MSNNNIKIFLILETLTSSYRVVFSTSLHSLLSSCIKIDFLLLLTTWLDIICVFARFYCSLLYNESSIVVQSLSRVQLFVTPWTAAHQASLSFAISWSLLKLMSIELVMLSNHFVLFHPLLLLFLCLLRSPKSVLTSLLNMLSYLVVLTSLWDLGTTGHSKPIGSLV